MTESSTQHSSASMSFFKNVEYSRSTSTDVKMYSSTSTQNSVLKYELFEYCITEIHCCN